MFINYCKNCLFPETKPNIYFDKDGICSACLNYNQRPKINFNKKEKEFFNFLKKQKKFTKSNYDCVIPVSGGKDSIFQILKYSLDV